MHAQQKSHDDNAQQKWHDDDNAQQKSHDDNAKKTSYDDDNAQQKSHDDDDKAQFPKPRLNISPGFIPRWGTIILLDECGSGSIQHNKTGH